MSDNKRSLFASIQRDTKQPSRKRLPKPESFEAYDESQGTSSSRMLLPSRSETSRPITLQDPPYKISGGLTWETNTLLQQSLPYKTNGLSSPSSVRNEGGAVAAGCLLKSVSYRVDEAVKYEVLSSD